MMSESGILEQCLRKCVSEEGATEFDEDVLITVVVEVGKRYAMAFLEVSKTARKGHVAEPFAAMVVEHQIGHERLVIRKTCSQVEVRKTVIVEVAKVASHHGDRRRQPLFFGDVTETSPAVSTIKARQFGRLFAPQKIQHRRVNGDVVSCREDVQNPVIVEIEEPCGKSVDRPLDAQLLRDVPERAVSQILVQTIGLP